MLIHQSQYLPICSYMALHFRHEQRHNLLAQQATWSLLFVIGFTGIFFGLGQFLAYSPLSASIYILSNLISLIASTIFVEKYIVKVMRHKNVNKISGGEILRFAQFCSFIIPFIAAVIISDYVL